MDSGFSGNWSQAEYTKIKTTTAAVTNIDLNVFRADAMKALKEAMPYADVETRDGIDYGYTGELLLRISAGKFAAFWRLRQPGRFELVHSNGMGAPVTMQNSISQLVELMLERSRAALRKLDYA